MRLGSWAWLAAMAALLAGCITVTYDGTADGKLSGQLLVIWVGEDNFVYWPYTNDPLVFTPSADLRQKLGVETFRPGLMYTDGASIPRPLRSLEGFSPWAYAPSAMLHDWIFAAHHCIVEGRPDAGDPLDLAEYEKVRKVGFDDSVVLLAQAMKNLMREGRVKRNNLAFDAISVGVETSVAQRLWDARDKCDPVSPEHQKMIRDAMADRRHGLRRLGTRPLAGVRPPVIVFQHNLGP